MTKEEIIKIIDDLKIDRPELSLPGNPKLWKTQVKYYIGWNNALKEVKRQVINNAKL